MKKIQICDSTYKRLQDHWEPLDTVDSVICKALDVLGLHSGDPADDCDPIEVDPKDASQLAYTKILEVCVDGEFEENINSWTSLQQHLIALACLREIDIIGMLNESPIEFVTGNVTTDGFKYIPEAGISIWTINAVSAWKVACKLVKELGITLSVKFLWKHNPNAAHRGKKGVVRI